MSERKEPTVSPVMHSKEDLSDRRSRGRTQQRASSSRPTYTERPAPPKSGASGFLWFTFMITLVAIGGLGYGFWQLTEAQKVIKSQSLRIAQLEDKLALSDDSASQSLASIGAKVRELNVKAVKAESEIDKLWATRNVNRKAIKENGDKIAALDKSTKKLAGAQAGLNQLKSSVAQTNKKIETLLPLQAAVDSTSQSVADHDLLLQSVRERVANQATSIKSLSSKLEASQSASAKLGSLDKRVKNTEEAITSFEAFRRTVNRDLLQLKQPKK